MNTENAPPPAHQPTASLTEAAPVDATAVDAAVPRTSNNRRRQARQAVDRAIAKLGAAVDAMGNGRNYSKRDLARVLERVLALIQETPRAYRGEITRLQRAITQLQAAQRATARGNQSGRRSEQERPLPLRAIEEEQGPAIAQPDEAANDESSVPPTTL